MKNLSAFKVFFHALAWCLFFLAPAVISPGPLFHKVTSAEMISLSVRTLTLMIYFYANLYYITPVILKKRGAIVFAIVSLLIIVVISNINSSIHHFYVEGRRMGSPPAMPAEWGPPPGQDQFGPPRSTPPMMFASPTFSSLLITTLVAIISSMLVFWEEWGKVQIEKQEQELQRVAAELTALKLQISPHFLFNTLNNIRWLVRSKADNAEEAVVKLSHLLRYILYQTDRDKVDLEPELNHLRDFIELQKMRIESPGAVQFSMTGDLSERQIVPLLLLPLVENVFKHGDFSGNYQNKIAITVSDATLIFKTENKISRSTEKENGIGLSNATKRLKLHYPDRHLLHYFEKDDVFFFQLELILS